MTTKVAISGRRVLRGALVLPLLLATMAAVEVAAAPRASALEAGVRTVLISRFDSGDVAYVKAAVEYQTITPRSGRTHFKIYCHNSNGQSVNCGAIKHDAATSNRHLDYWNETYGWESVQYIIGQDPPLPVYDHLSADYYSPWDCFGKGSDQYRAVLELIQVTDRFGQEGRLHTVVSNTANVYVCCSGLPQSRALALSSRSPVRVRLPIPSLGRSGNDGCPPTSHKDQAELHEAVDLWPVVPLGGDPAAGGLDHDHAADVDGPSGRRQRLGLGAEDQPLGLARRERAG